MKKLKIIIIALAILLIILLLIMFASKKNINQNGIETPPENSGPQDALIKLEDHTIKETDDYRFFTVQEIIQNLYTKINIKDNNAVYNMTSEEYKRDNEETLETILSAYTETPNHMSFYLQEQYKLENYNQVIYYAYGFILETGKNELQNKYFKINVDYKNETFSIEPIKMEEYQRAQNGQIKKSKTIRIEKNKDNTYEQDSYSSKRIADRYIQDYILKLKYKTNIAYDLLEENYRRRNFNNIEQFIEYIESNVEKLNHLEIQNVQTQITENAREYTITDTNDNQYKLIVYGALDYRIII